MSRSFALNIFNQTTDSIGNLSSAKIHDLCDEDNRWLPALQSAFSLNVSFHSNCLVRYDQGSIEFGLCVRLLFRCAKSKHLLIDGLCAYVSCASHTQSVRTCANLKKIHPGASVARFILTLCYSTASVRCGFDLYVSAGHFMTFCPRI
jgi:hypothetical protein